MTKKNKIVVCIIVVLAFMIGTVSGIFIVKNLKNFKSNDSSETIFEDKTIKFEIKEIRIVKADVNNTVMSSFLKDANLSFIVIDYSLTNNSDKTMVVDNTLDFKLFENGVLVADKNNFLMDDQISYQLSKSVKEIQTNGTYDGRIYFWVSELRDNYELNLIDKKSNEILKILKFNLTDKQIENLYFDGTYNSDSKLKYKVINED